MVLKGYQARDGAILMTNINNHAPVTRTVHASVNPNINIDPWKTQLWRLAKLSESIYYVYHELQLAGRPLHISGEDGTQVWQDKSVNSLTIAPGKRFDALVQGGASSAVDLKTLPYNQLHPIHIHANDFQVLSINDEPCETVRLQGTINLPAKVKGTVRIPLLDFTGKFVYHCHILNRAGMGMMALVEVTAESSRLLEVSEQMGDDRGIAAQTFQPCAETIRLH